MFPGNDLLAQGLAALFELVFGKNLLGGVTDLQSTIAGMNGGAYAFAKSINSTVVKPIAATILAIILTLDLARIGSRIDGDQKLGVQMVATSIIKACLVVVAIQNVDLILGAINQVGDTLIQSISLSSTSGFGGGAPGVEELKTVDLFGQLGTLVALLIPALFGVIASVALKVVVFVRFAEIYVLSAAATLPLVFMGHPETKGIAIGFLKKYAAAVLHGVILLITLKMFEFFGSKLGGGGGGISADNLIGTTFEAWPSMILSSAVFLFFVFSSGKLAHALLGD